MVADDDIPSKTLEDCFDFIHQFKNSLTARTMNDFEEVLSCICKHAAKVGLSDNQLEDLLHFLDKNDLRIKTLELLFSCLVPIKLIPTELTKKVVTYVLQNYRRIPPKATVIVLKWIIGLIEFELTDVKVLDTFYRFYFFLLKFSDTLHRYVAQIIYMLTKPEDVVEENVHLVEQVMIKYLRPPPFLQALLSKFKCYQPQLISTKIPEMKVLSATSCLSHEMVNSLKEAQKRNLKDRPEQLEELFSCKNETAVMSYEDSKKCHEIVGPFPKYLKLVPFEKLKLEDVRTIYELERNFNNVELPSNILSLLLTDVGIHYLAFGGNDIQQRFAFRLNYAFNKVFLKCTMKVDTEEEEFLLKRVVKLETYLQQGITVVSRFLANYLVCWDGVKHRRSILKLIEWTTLSSYSELEERILSPLFKHYASYDVEVKIEIINSLLNLLTNMFMVDVKRFQEGTKPSFLGVHPEWVSNFKTLSSTIQAIEHFLIFGLLAEPKSCTLLHKAISFYSLVFQLESQLPVMTVVDFSVVYRSLFSNNSAAFSRICGLLSSYRSQISEMDPDEAIKKYHDQIKLIERFVNDIINCLWHGKAVSNGENGIIFKTMSSALKSELSKFSDPDSAFILSNNVMMVPFIMAIIKLAPNVSLDTVKTRENVCEILETQLEEVANFIREVLESDNQHFFPVFESHNMSMSSV